MAIEQQVAEIEADAGKAIASASDEASLEAIRVAELGKKGRVSLLMLQGRYGEVAARYGAQWPMQR